MNVTRADMADLVYFFAIARHQSFSKAAVELGVSASRDLRSGWACVC